MYQCYWFEAKSTYRVRHNDEMISLKSGTYSIERKELQISQKKTPKIIIIFWFEINTWFGQLELPCGRVYFKYLKIAYVSVPSVTRANCAELLAAVGIIVCKNQNPKNYSTEQKYDYAGIFTIESYSKQVSVVITKINRLFKMCYCL